MWGRVDFLPRSNKKRWKNKEDVYATGWDDGCDGKGPNDSAAEEEVKVMGLREGDELCLSYLVDDQMEGKVNGAGEFLVEKK